MVPVPAFRAEAASNIVNGLHGLGLVTQLGPLAIAIVPTNNMVTSLFIVISGDGQVRSLIPLVIPAVFGGAGAHAAEDHLGISKVSGNLHLPHTLGAGCGTIDPNVLVAFKEECGKAGAVLQPIGIGLDIEETAGTGGFFFLGCFSGLCLLGSDLVRNLITLDHEGKSNLGILGQNQGNIGSRRPIVVVTVDLVLIRAGGQFHGHGPDSAIGIGGHFVGLLPHGITIEVALHIIDNLNFFRFFVQLNPLAVTLIPTRNMVTNLFVSRSRDGQIRSLVPLVVPVIGRSGGVHAAEDHLGVSSGYLHLIDAIPIGIRTI